MDKAFKFQNINLLTCFTKKTTQEHQIKMKKKVYLVDDEYLALEELKVLLGPYEDLELVGMSDRVDRAIEECNELKPDLIFLDINMPVMNGWEFLDEYQKLSKEQKAKMVLVMLTTSINPDDYEKSKQYPDVAGFRNKPLSTDLIKDIMHQHFNRSLV